MSLFSTKWTTQLSNSGERTVSVLRNNAGLYAGSYGNVYRIDKDTGTELHVNKLPGMGWHPVSLAAPDDCSRLLVGINGYVLALKADTLDTIWSRSLPRCGYNEVSLLWARGRLYAASKGYVYRLNADGAVDATNSLSGYGRHDVRMAHSGDTLYAGTAGYALALDLELKRITWASPLVGSGVTHVIPGRGVVYAGCGGRVHRLDAATGNVLHSNQMSGTGEAEVRLALDATGNQLYAGTNGYAVGLHPDTLATAYRSALPGGKAYTDGYTVDVVAGDKVAYFGCAGRVHQVHVSGVVTRTQPLTGIDMNEVGLAPSLRHERQLFAGAQGRVFALALSGYTVDRGPWMKGLGATIQNRKLREVAIPGTHDSGTYGITRESPAAKDDTWLLALLVPQPVQPGGLLVRWSVAQGVDFATQLASGIRYLDLRVQGGSTLNFVHGQVGPPVEDLIRQLQGFLDDKRNEKEIVLLDFQAFFEMTPEMHTRLATALKKAFGDKLAPASLGTEVTVDQLWKSTHRVITFYRDSGVPAKVFTDHPFLWKRNDSLNSPWPNTVDPATLAKFVDDKRKEFENDPRFSVLQGVLTPDPLFVARAELPFSSGYDSLATLAEWFNPQLVEWLKKKWSTSTNVVICDWYNLSPDFIDTVIGLNGAVRPPGPDPEGAQKSDGDPGQGGKAKPRDEL